MTKADLLKMLANDYRNSVRQADDISLRDYKEAILRETGVSVGDRRAYRRLGALVASGEYVSLIVSDKGHNVRVWRPKKERKTRKNA